MKVLQQSDRELILQSRPWWLWIAAGVFIVAGFIPLLVLGSHTLSCRRSEPSQGSCRLSQSNLFSSDVKTIPLQNLQGARLDTRRDSDGDYSYRVSLLTNQGDVPFATYVSGMGDWSYEAQSVLAQRINTFVQNPEITTLEAKREDRGFALLFIGIFSLVGVLILIFFGHVITCGFDKRLNQFTLTRKGLLGTKVIEHSLKEIKAVRVETLRDSDGNTYRVSFMLKSGASIPLTGYYSSGRQGKQHTAELIQNFLGLQEDRGNG